MNASNCCIFVFLILFMRIPNCVIGHARLIDPPSRASAWRYGFNTPINYNDNEGNCGGFSHQWGVNNGRCGACGDSWSRKPSPDEAGGGPFVSGTIVRKYTVGQTIIVTVEITANHKGFMEFRICPVEDKIEERKIHDCLNRNLITMAHKNKTRHHVALRQGYHHIALVLPKNITCSRCVLQWRYVAGNNWGICPDGVGALGCGPQEEFRACADIAILPRNSFKIPGDEGEKSEEPSKIYNYPEIAFTFPNRFFSATMPNNLTKVRTTVKPKGTIKPTISHMKPPWLTISLTTSSFKSSLPTLSRRITTTTTAPKESFRKLCIANGYWKFVPGIKHWCNANCNHITPYCPSSHCTCS